MADILPSSGHFLGFVAKESRLKPAMPLLGLLGMLNFGNRSFIPGPDVSSCGRGEKAKCSLLREGLSGHQL